MTPSKFEEVIKARAKERVDKKIREFKDTVIAALKKLYGPNKAATEYTWQLSKRGKEVMLIMASENHQKNWPPELWGEEEELVGKELFAVMDEMQRALLAKDDLGPDANQPEREEVKP
jgi:hypothetical protein